MLNGYCYINFLQEKLNDKMANKILANENKKYMAIFRAKF